MSKNEIAVQEELPAYLAKQDPEAGGRGSEGVSTDDLVIPRLELAQALSPCINKKKPEYIEGIEIGDLYNNITRENYGPNVNVVPVLFKKEYLIWKDRDSGDGGFRGAYPDHDLAEMALAELDESEQSLCEIVDTAQQFVMIIHDDGSFEEAVFSMAKSKMKVSKNWNSLIRLNGRDRFSRVYAIASFEDKGNSGEFQNVAVTNAGFPSEAVYTAAEEVYESIASGKKDIDRSVDEAADKPLRDDI